MILTYNMPFRKVYQKRYKRGNQKPRIKKRQTIHWLKETRGSQEPVIAHLVFNFTSKVNRKWGCYT